MINTFNVFELFQKFFDTLISISTALYNFLFESHNFFGFSVTPIYVTGAVVVAIMLFRFIVK